MQIVHCTLTRMGYHLEVRDGSRDRPFVCGAFRSRFGSGSIWH